MFDENPFPEIESHTVYLEPFLNTYYKEYQNILHKDYYCYSLELLPQR